VLDPGFLQDVNVSILPRSDATYDLGSLTNKWKNLYLSGDVYVGGNVRGINPWKLVSGILGFLGLAPFIMGNALGFRAPYRAEISTDGGATWTDVTNTYTWAYLTDGRAAEVAIPVSANQEVLIRLYYNVGGWTFASALVIVARWINNLTRVRVEASSTSDFSSDVVVLYDATPNLPHWDNTSIHLFSREPSYRPYIRITIGALRTSAGEIRFRELILLTYGDVNRMWEGYFPYSWDHNKNVFFENRVGIGTTSPAEKLHVIGNVRIDDAYKLLWSDVNLYRGGADLLKTDDDFDARSIKVGGVEVVDTGRNLKNVASIVQSLLPDSDNLRDLGSSSLRWRDLYVAGTVYGGFWSWD